jgi:hypothetical protein
MNDSLISFCPTESALNGQINSIISQSSNISDNAAIAIARPPKLPTPLFSKDSLIASVGRGPLPTPEYLTQFSQRYRELAARFRNSDGIIPDYLEPYYRGQNHMILLHFPVTGLISMMCPNSDGIQR